MSTGGMGSREVAYRLFAAEYDDAEYAYSESDEERAPNYVITPTGARANRVFVVGVLTEVEQVGDDILRGRVVDPTGAFVLYAGQYQPDEQAFLESATPPTFVAVTGKARTFQPDDSDQIFTSIRPESINEVDADTRDRWTVQAAERTLERIGQLAMALSLSERGAELEQTLRSRGVSERDAQGIALAIDYYGTTPTYLAALRDVALDAAGIVAGETDEVEGISASPDEHGTVTANAVLDSLSGLSIEMEAEPTSDVSETTTETITDSSTGTDESDQPAETPTDEATSTTEQSTADAEPASDDLMTGTTTESTTEPEAFESETESVESEPTTGETESTAETTEPPVEPDDSDDIGDFDPGEFDIPEEEREQVEEEFGTEFQTGAEVDEPGEADIGTPEPATDSEPVAEEPQTPEESVESAEASEPETASPEEQPSDDEPADESADRADEPAEPDDIQETVVQVMHELGDGSGADREELYAEMHSRYGLDEETVENAIEDALMAGQCYEPDDSTVTPI